MTPPFRRRVGFAGQPLALRRAVLEILGRRGWLTAADIAAAVYSRRIMIRTPAWRRPTTSELVSVRRALRCLAAKGRVVVDGRYRRRKIFRLVERPR
jgi:hypothetical protein